MFSETRKCENCSGQDGFPASVGVLDLEVLVVSR